MTAEGRDVQRAPAIPVGQPHVRPEPHQHLDQLQVAQLTALVEGCLALRVEDVEVDLALSRLQQPPQPRRVPVAHGLAHRALVLRNKLR